MDEATKPPKQRAYIGPINVNTLHKRLMYVLNKDSRNLVEKALAGPLGRDLSAVLVAYLKLTKELMKKHEKEADALPDNELEAIANGKQS